MLVLTRGVDEAFVVGELIVRVVEINDEFVRLGIASPHAVPRYREVTLRRGSDADSEFVGMPQALTRSDARP
jgi:carbon storage regulator CsrA